MQGIEKYIWASSLIGFIAIAYLQITFLDARLERLGSASKTVNTMYDKAMFDMYFTAFVGYLDHLVCAVWLFFSAKSDSLSKSPWALFGLAFGVVGVACFYAASVHFQLKSIRTRSAKNDKKT